MRRWEQAGGIAGRRLMPTRNRRVVGPLIVILAAGASFMTSHRFKSLSLASPRKVLLARGLAGFLGISHASKPQSSAFHPRAFVARAVVRRFGTIGDKGPSVPDLTMFARKGDGSWAEMTTTDNPSGEVLELRTFWDVSSDREVTLEPTTKSVMTYFLTPQEMHTKVEDSLTCPPAVKSPTAQHQRILGYDAVNATEEDPGSRHNQYFVAWVAPELGCYALRRSETRSDGPHNEFEATSITEGEPPAWMFQVPADYVERSPSELSAEWAARFGQPFWPDHNVLATADRKYFAHRPKQTPSRP